MIRLIKNRTPFVGVIRLKFEKYPHYQGGSPWSIVNKVHLNLGFTKLVSRMYPIEGKNESIDPEKIELINKHTGGVIKDHEWWTTKDKNGDTHQRNTLTEDDEEIVSHHMLRNSFLTHDGKYIGDIQRAWWFYKNNFIVYDEKPNIVAIKLNPYSYNKRYWGINSDNVEGVYGFSHRGGQLFKLGDKIFEPNWDPYSEDDPLEFFTEKEWEGYQERRRKSERKQKDEGWLHEGESTPITDYIPFKRRGKKTIKTWEDAIQAAKNLGSYLS
jgi:hypothetical protein